VGVRDNSIDALVTDPPAGIGFFGQSWDDDRGGRRQWIEWLTSILQECVRVLKPGAHALVWALPRVSHWTATALDDAGLDVRDVITHHFGNGLPKSTNVQRANNGASRETGPGKGNLATSNGRLRGNSADGGPLRLMREGPGSGRDSDEGPWEGWGTALKPASEHWILARKPLEGTVYQNVEKYGTGGLNIDACRIGGGDPLPPTLDARSSAGVIVGSPLGRFPANVIISHSPDCEEVGFKTIGKGQRKAGTASGGIWSESTGKPAGPTYGEETIPVYECVDDCPIRIIDEQTGEGASRFFYTPKASRAERERSSPELCVKAEEAPRYQHQAA
jgi:site-specific DNA-methyltransferase (adenine-specific)